MRLRTKENDFAPTTMVERFEELSVALVMRASDDEEVDSFEIGFEKSWRVGKFRSVQTKRSERKKTHP